MRNDKSIYLDFVHENNYQAVLSVSQQMPTIPIAKPMQTNCVSYKMKTILSISIVI